MKPKAEEGAGIIDAKADQYPATTRDVSSGLLQIANPVRNGLDQVESLLRSELVSNEPWLAELMQGLQHLGGKRMRPLMVLLFGLASGKVKPSHVQASVAFELVHLATLVHDDIIDQADIRRGQPTLHRGHGSRPAVLTGDYLFSRAFVLASQIGQCEIPGELALAVANVCSGEIRQNHLAGNFQLGLEEYVGIVSAKTASLCAGACRCGVTLNTGDACQAEAAWHFGNHVGIAFQVIDDCLDLEGSTTVVGKTLGTDAASGKLTYPVIHAMAHNDGEYADRIAGCLSAWSGDSAGEFAQLLEETDSLTAARQFADLQVKMARKVLLEFPPSAARDALAEMADFVIRRDW